MSTTTGKGGFATIKSLTQLTKKLDPLEPFMVQSSMANLGYSTLQTRWMRDVVTESVLDWTENSSSGPGRHGFVTDGDHSYFREGTLLTTCAFNSVLMAWAPVLYTWVVHLETEHHRPHFRYLNRKIVEAAGDKFNSKSLLNAFDFSSSQRSAHAEEYAATLRDLMPNWSTLVSSAQQAQYQAWLDEASNHQVGCETHFYRSVLVYGKTQI
ncbi:hypothetical protein QCA50_021050 [Cerrena zonata]|uniref:Uncharacterized protein n=1 Tax=Cerrena zonata TaxID=2478898 RepID=A0AAW0FER5_9APHY